MDKPIPEAVSALMALAKEIRWAAGNNNANYHRQWAERIEQAILNRHTEPAYDRNNIAAALEDLAIFADSSAYCGLKADYLREQANLLLAADNAHEAMTDNRAPSGDVEQRARELLATEYERVGFAGYIAYAENIRKTTIEEDDQRPIAFAIRAIVAALQGREGSGFTVEEVNTMRQWFDSVQDTNGGYLNPDDYVLAAKLYRQCGIRVPNSIASIASSRAAHD